MKLKDVFFPMLILVVSAFNSNSQNTNTLIPFASGLQGLVCIANAGDDRLFVVDQHGSISIVNPDGMVEPQAFLDIKDRVAYGGERGLLGVAFHPEYQTTGYLFVNYIGVGDSTHISRFKVNADNPNIADPQSELKLLTIFQPFQNHNGGDLNFGPDGFLYIGLGDGGSGGDPGKRAQNPMEFLGKMLRIDVDHGNPYAIPESNPFYNSSDTLKEIWALGLRNPWRFSFDKLTGDLWIADVGQNAIEEINFQPANSTGGENYGWRCYEGNQTFNTDGCLPSESLTFPVYTYPQGDECSVTGGYVYRGSTSSPFYGHYFFSDYCSDRIWTLHQENGNWIKTDFGRFTGNNFTTFGEDAKGQLYIGGIKSGKIFQINDQTTGIEPQQITEGIIVKQLPFGNTFRIEKTTESNSMMLVNVCDIKGTVLFQTEKRESQFEINLNTLSSGIYSLTATCDRIRMTQKLILLK